MPTLYFIKEWSDKFETAETRKLENLKWSPSPNKLDGLGYRRMVQQRDRCDLFAAWNLMRAIASKTMPKERRGQLERDGQPLSADDMALMSGFPATVFERAIAFFSSPEMQWLGMEMSEQDPSTAADRRLVPPQSPARPAAVPALPASSPAVEKVRKIENRKKGIDLPAAFAASGLFVAKWEKWLTTRRAMGKKPKDWDEMFQEQVNWLEQYSIETAIEILSSSIRNNYQGLFPPKGKHNGNSNNGHSEADLRRGRERSREIEGKSIPIPQI